MDEFGWLDTNVFIHALFPNDSQYTRSAEIIDGLVQGTGWGWISPLVVHELTYVLQRLVQFPGRQDVGTYLAGLLAGDTVLCTDKDVVLAALSRWSTQSVGFVDAYLHEMALHTDTPVCSANVRDFPGVANSFPIGR